MKKTSQENVSVKELSTFKIGGTARYLTVIKNIDDLSFALDLSKKENVRDHILGGGSNTIFKDGVLDLHILKIEIPGIEIINEDNNFAYMKIGAGENWDGVVAYAVDHNLSGIEALSLIPGTSGATPVQNVGAYGQEIKDTLLEVEVFNKLTHEVKIMKNEECDFSYRDSIFKRKDNPFIVISTTLKLSKKVPTIPNYPGVVKYFSEHKDLAPSLQEIRKAVITIRTNKLPRVEYDPNVGSFFKNVITDKNVVEEIKKRFPDISFYPEANGKVKINSGWLIEKAGFKGKELGKIKVSQKSALVLINKGQADFEELMKAREEIITKVKEMFGIELEQEPVLVG